MVALVAKTPIRPVGLSFWACSQLGAITLKIGVPFSDLFQHHALAQIIVQDGSVSAYDHAMLLGYTKVLHHYNIYLLQVLFHRTPLKRKLPLGFLAQPLSHTSHVPLEYL